MVLKMKSGHGQMVRVWILTLAGEHGLNIIPNLIKELEHT